MNTLKVSCQGQLVGTLSLKNNTQFSFVYSTDWLEAETAFPISVSLPLQSQVFNDAACRAFFANLLPEGVIREQICRQLKISVDNDFSLLGEIGVDCAGALAIARTIPDVSEAYYEKLPVDELERFVNVGLSQAWGREDSQALRLSLAGVQDKVAVYLDAGAFYLPHGAAASSHILKPAIKRFIHSSLNEYVCMQLAKQVGLNVPKAFLIPGHANWYCCERFDRKLIGYQKVKRLHQEDFCQALNRLPSQKYEAEGGPGFEACFNVVWQYSDNPALDVEQLLLWALFNFLIGNADAHGKNIALLFGSRHGHCRLAPFYDLLSTALYPELNSRMAMKIGGENRPKWVQKRHWQRFVVSANLSWRAWRCAAEMLLERMPLELNNMLQEEPLSELSGLVKVLEQRSQWLARAL